MRINYHRTTLILLLIFIFSAAATLAQQAEKSNLQSILMSEFTYQGSLTDNSLPASGNYDFEFKLVDANGVVITAQQRLNVAVANGIFTVRLDFGSAPFTSGSGRFIEIGVRAVGSAAFTTLSPRQPITTVPYAVSSGTAIFAQIAEQSSDSLKLGGVAAGQYVLTTDTRLSDERSPLAGSGNYIQNTNVEQVADFAINGTGSAGILKAYNVNAVFQYSLNGGKFITAPGAGNTFLGIGSGSNWTTGTNNSFFGKDSGLSNAEASNNSFFGASSGMNNLTGAGNSFFGSGSGKQNTSGLQNSFFGWNAGTTNQTGGYNSFFGASAGANVLNGFGNAFFGSGTGINTTSGGDNAFFGRGSGHSNQTGNDNAYFGSYSGYLGFGVTKNAFFGAYSGNSNGGSYNAFFGSSAGFNNKGADNTFLGFSAGHENTNGSDNVFIGSGAGFANTTGTFNIFIGKGAGAGAPTGTQNIALGHATVFGQNVTNSVLIGAGANTNTSNQIVLGHFTQNTSVTGLLLLQSLGGSGTEQLCRTPSKAIGQCSSSIRYKTDVQNFTSGLEVIRRLRPVAFTWKEGGRRDLGFIAEEVNAVEPLMTTANEKGEVEGVKYDRISAALVNAVNEQQKQIEAQQETITRQQEQINELKKIVCSMQPQAGACKEQQQQ